MLRRSTRTRAWRRRYGRATPSTWARAASGRGGGARVLAGRASVRGGARGAQADPGGGTDRSRRGDGAGTRLRRDRARLLGRREPTRAARGAARGRGTSMIFDGGDGGGDGGRRRVLRGETDRARAARHLRVKRPHLFALFAPLRPPIGLSTRLLTHGGRVVRRRDDGGLSAQARGVAAVQLGGERRPQAFGGRCARAAQGRSPVAGAGRGHARGAEAVGRLGARLARGRVVRRRRRRGARVPGVEAREA
mmetsp:Transcript_14662/g.50624  ORF Transcript_14662/g.50624 Transcript_14662/m.50624 type:complete len:250 (-) Transcript_14662:643-1392(-)